LPIQTKQHSSPCLQLEQNLNPLHLEFNGNNGNIGKKHGLNSISIGGSLEIMCLGSFMASIVFPPFYERENVMFYYFELFCQGGFEEVPVLIFITGLF